MKSHCLIFVSVIRNIVPKITEDNLVNKGMVSGYHSHLFGA